MILSDVINIFTNCDNFVKTTCDSSSALSQIVSISCDSRQVKSGTLFFAKGQNFKAEYLSDAIKKGAAAYVSERDFSVEIPLILVKNIRAAMPVLADAFYGSPTKKYPLVGITGTKGKTSASYMLNSIMKKAFGENVGIISTNEARCGEKVYQKTGSTPESLELFSILSGFHEQNAAAAVMEVSSQGLKYNRVDCVSFEIGAFLNLSPDHISPTEHSDFDDYKAAKKRMLTLCRVGVVNTDDSFAEEIIAAATCEKLITTGIAKPADIKAYNIRGTKSGSVFDVCGLVSIENVTVDMPGKFNIYNALIAISCAYSLGISSENIKAGLLGLKIPGRLEVLENKGITVLVDYAHNKLSFEAVFDYIETYYPNAKKICVFGCVGNKALDRRKELPEVACPHSDLIVMTSDDPANEDPDEIFAEVETELKRFRTPYIFIKDREEAVEYAIDKAESGDVVFLAGKGHEKTQIIRGVSVPYGGDKETAVGRLMDK